MGYLAPGDPRVHSLGPQSGGHRGLRLGDPTLGCLAVGDPKLGDTTVGVHRLGDLAAMS